MLGDQTRSFSPGEVPLETLCLSVWQRMQLTGMQLPLLCSGGQPTDACCKLHLATAGKLAACSMLWSLHVALISRLAWQTLSLPADRNATEGLNLVANTWARANVKPGDEASLQTCTKLPCVCTACDAAMQCISHDACMAAVVLRHPRPANSGCIPLPKCNGGAYKSW